eukprot:jgi/Mesvir1/21458/Mv03915-RA.1
MAASIQTALGFSVTHRNFPSHLSAVQSGNISDRRDASDMCQKERVSPFSHTLTLSCPSRLESSFSGARLLKKGSTDSFNSLRCKATASPSMAVSAQAMADTKTDIPSLANMPLVSFLTPQGYIQPEKQAETKASVFAILDSDTTVQYIGFATDIRNSLRKLMGRRPDLCFYYKVYNLTSLDQKRMLATREAWYRELGEAPRGNKEDYQRALWEQPVDAGAVSERGKLMAAQSRAQQLLGAMQARGVKEPMIYDPALLAKGQCDVLASAEMSEEEMAKLARIAAEQASALRHIKATGPGGEVEFDVLYKKKYTTNGGWMYDVDVVMDEQETHHRVIVGRAYAASLAMDPEALLEKTFAFLLSKRVQRQTQGVILSGVFPINYFTVSEVEQWYEDEFAAMFEARRDGAGGSTAALPWRFDRVHAYGSQADSLPIIGPGADKSA